MSDISEIFINNNVYKICDAARLRDNKKIKIYKKNSAKIGDDVSDFQQTSAAQIIHSLSLTELQNEIEADYSNTSYNTYTFAQGGICIYIASNHSTGSHAACIGILALGGRGPYGNIRKEKAFQSTYVNTAEAYCYLTTPWYNFKNFVFDENNPTLPMNCIDLRMACRFLDTANLTADITALGFGIKTTSLVIPE